MGTLIFTLITVTIGVLSIAFCGLSVFRLRNYIQAYRFDRSQYTPLFGFIHLRMVMWLYVFGTLLFAGFLITFFMYLHQ